MEYYTFPVIISNSLSKLEEEKLRRMLRKHKKAIGWTIVAIQERSPSLCMHKILKEDDFKPLVEHQGRLNLNMKEVVRTEMVIDAILFIRSQIVHGEPRSSCIEKIWC